MSYRRRLTGCAVAALMIATGATALGAGAAPRPTIGAGCHGLSPASAQDCTADQMQAALEQER